MPLQTEGLVLREDQDPKLSAVEAIGQRKIDDPIAATERDGGLGARSCERIQPGAFPAC